MRLIIFFMTLFMLLFIMGCSEKPQVDISEHPYCGPFMSSSNLPAEIINDKFIYQDYSCDYVLEDLLNDFTEIDGKLLNSGKIKDSYKKINLLECTYKNISESKITDKIVNMRGLYLSDFNEILECGIAV